MKRPRPGISRPSMAIVESCERDRKDDYGRFRTKHGLPSTHVVTQATENRLWSLYEWCACGWRPGNRLPPVHILRAALHKYAEPDGMVEHIYAEGHGDRTELVFFLHEDVGDRAPQTVRRLWRRAARDLTPLDELSVLETTTLLPPAPDAPEEV